MIVRQGFVSVILAGAVFAVAGAALQALSPPVKDYEAISLFGEKLLRPRPDAAAAARYEQALRDFEREPGEEQIIWLGRRTAYLGRYREAIAVYTEGLRRFPASYRLLRHRGHRYISIRQLARAIADFEKAAALAAGRPLEVEPDGVPNPAGKPVSNTQFNIFYHLGLARYLARDFSGAESAYRECLRWSVNDDSIVAVTDWLYLSLRRQGKTADAEKTLASMKPDPTILENGAYLERLKMFRGETPPEAYAKDKAGEPGPEKAIRLYGLGLAALWRGEKAEAARRFREMLAGANGAAFSSIAAEVELAELVRAEPPRGSAAETLRSWTLFWNLYDLDMTGKLFAAGDESTYFSSEKPGLIRGYEALLAHHRGFGFVPGGKNADARLWLEDIDIKAGADAASAAAIWFFDKDVGAAGAIQRGPVTFVLRRESDGWKIVHAHFSNDPAPR